MVFYHHKPTIWVNIGQYRDNILCKNLAKFSNLGIAVNYSYLPLLTVTYSYFSLLSGDCSCQPGVTGKHCSSCLPQHWDFTAEGCKSCECELDGAVGCNVDTGICQCLAGVTGEKCDRWAKKCNPWPSIVGNSIHDDLSTNYFTNNYYSIYHRTERGRFYEFAIFCSGLLILKRAQEWFCLLFLKVSFGKNEVCWSTFPSTIPIQLQTSDNMSFAVFITDVRIGGFWYQREDVRHVIIVCTPCWMILMIFRWRSLTPHKVCTSLISVSRPERDWRKSTPLLRVLRYIASQVSFAVMVISGHVPSLITFVW